MLNIEFLQSSGFFKTISLKQGDVIFDEWEIDNNLYIVVSWKIDVLKHTTIERSSTKKLATLLKMDFFWEAWLSTTDEPKQVKLVASSDTELLSIDAQSWVEDFIKENPEAWLSFLKHIIYITNKRLNKNNRQIAADYELNKEINNIEKITLKSIFHIIDRMKAIIECDYILFFEHNMVVENYYTLKYDTRHNMSLNNMSLEIKSIANIMKDIKNITDIGLFPFNTITNLSIWDRNLGFFITGRKNNIFSENEKNMLISMGNSLAGIIKQKEVLEEERNKNYIKENNI